MSATYVDELGANGRAAWLSLTADVRDAIGQLGSRRGLRDGVRFKVLMQEHAPPL